MNELWTFGKPVEGTVVYLIIYKVLYIPGGCLEFLPSTVCHSIVTEFVFAHL